MSKKKGNVSVQSLADRLWKAQITRVPCAPLTEDVPGLSVGDAYRIQGINLERQGEAIVGRKIGLTSRAVQQWLGVEEPDFGGLTAAMEVADGGVIKTAELLQPRAEAEVAFVMGRDLVGEAITGAQVMRAVEYVVPAIEVIASRIKDWKITYCDTIADNASSGMFVLGQGPRRLESVELGLAGMTLRKGGAVVSTGAGAACMGHPVVALGWLARTLARLGTPLREGDVVLSGALGPVTPVEQGDVVEAKISGLGGVSVRFE